MMHISDNGLSLIKRFEGCRLTAYKCQAGVWTIGYGHTYGVYQGMTISKAQAESFLREDVKKFEEYVYDYYKVYGWNQNQFDALVSFAFNCGNGNLDKLLDGGHRSVAVVSQKILLYNKANGMTLQGLVNRRVAEKKLFDRPMSGIGAYYYPRYTGYSYRIDEVMRDIGATAQYDETKRLKYQQRKPIATANGISGYIGTATQNVRLIDLAKMGKLRRPYHD